jgi:eukaryotic-like serine/threonine-protein kinase
MAWDLLQSTRAHSDWCNWLLEFKILEFKILEFQKSIRLVIPGGSEILPLMAMSVALAPGDRIGDRYIFERKLAEGGMAYIVVARDTDELVAIKLLKPHAFEQEDGVARFAKEAKATALIDSEHCIKVITVGQDHKLGPFVVMELLDGMDLRHIIDQRGAQPTASVAEIAIQVCDALSAAHSIGIVHRDIKPENIFVVQEAAGPSARVLDFGISKGALTGYVMNTDISLVNTQALLGSPVYMAPEQMRSTSEVDARADIWSLGISMYEAVTGIPPWHSESVTAQCAMVLEKECPPANVVNPNVPAEFSALILWCLQKDREQRPRDVGELARALLAFAPPRAGSCVQTIVGRMQSAAKQLPQDAPPALAVQPLASDQPKSAVLIWAALGTVLLLGVVALGFVSYIFLKSGK